VKDRLIKILTHYGYNATRLADEISVQRSGISHIISGRNLPSFDFITKILTRFPDIDPNWLVLGKGPMLRQEHSSGLTEKEIPDLIMENPKPEKVTNVTQIDQIVIFYKDSTCKAYFPPET